MVAFLVRQQLSDSHTTAEYLRAVWPMVKYVCGVMVCFVIGLDAFLVKYRMAVHFIDTSDLDLGGLVHTFIFLFQILGIINLTWFSRERLCIFIFGGEDGNVEPEEKLRWDLWNAILAKAIYKRFGPGRGTVVMLGFDDYDFQSLVL